MPSDRDDSTAFAIRLATAGGISGSTAAEARPAEPTDVLTAGVQAGRKSISPALRRSPTGLRFENFDELVFHRIRRGRCNLRRRRQTHKLCSVGAHARQQDEGVEQLAWRPNPLVDFDRPTSRSYTPNVGEPMHTHRRTSSHQDLVTTCDNP